MRQSVKAVQHNFEKAVWEVEYTLQQSQSTTLSAQTIKEKDKISRIVDALKTWLSVSEEAVQREITLHWTANHIFTWQSSLEKIDWLPLVVLDQCKANFAWFSANVKVTIAIGYARSPGFQEIKKKDTKKRATPPSESDDDEESATVESDEKTPTPAIIQVKQKKTATPLPGIKKPVILAEANQRSSTPIFNPRIHIRNANKCKACLPTDKRPEGRDCFVSTSGRSTSKSGTRCMRCILNHTKCVNVKNVEVVIIAPPAKKRKGNRSESPE